MRRTLSSWCSNGRPTCRHRIVIRMRPAPIPQAHSCDCFSPPGKVYRRVAFVALGEGRELIGPILETALVHRRRYRAGGMGHTERRAAAMPPGVTLPSALTEKGDPHLGSRATRRSFLDSYHLLFHGPRCWANCTSGLPTRGPR